MNYLIHHGIKGQHWGIQNGPPYPLDAKTHRKVIDKAKETTRKVKERVNDYRNSFDKQKAIKIGAIAAGAALAAVGGYYLYKSGALNKLVQAGKSAAKDIDLDAAIPNTFETNNVQASGIKTKIADSSSAGLSPKDLEKHRSMIAGINGSNVGENGRDNCSSCTVAYIMNRLFGGNFKALGADVFGHAGRKVSEIESLFKEGTINRIDQTSKFENNSGQYGCRFNKSLIDMIPNGSTGMLSFNDGKPRLDKFGNYLRDKDGQLLLGRHIAAYEKSADGIFSLVENQKNKIFEGESLRIPFEHDGYKFCDAILDCSKAELADDYKSALPKWVR